MHKAVVMHSRAVLWFVHSWISLSPSILIIVAQQSPLRIAP